MFNTQTLPIQTNWVVFTGAPCAGKTTMIHEFASQNYKTAGEIVRLYVDELLTGDTPPEDIEKDLRSEATHQTILKRRILREQQTDPMDLVFFDRGALDSPAYYVLNNHKLDEALKSIDQHSRKYKYKCVFIFDILPIEKDGVRHESEEERKQLDKSLFNFYYRYGCTLIRVPVLSIEDRYKFICQHLELRPGSGEGNTSTISAHSSDQLINNSSGLSRHF